MTIRRLHYQIDYVHILTFREQYKNIISRYFAFEGVEYAIDEENSINERIRLFFKNESIAIFLNKESLIILFEGDSAELKSQNGPMKIFWDIYDDVKKLNNYYRTARHILITHAVEILEEDKVKNLLKNNPYLKMNPFGKLDEFSFVYEQRIDEKVYKMQYGNYSEKDIKKHELMPFKSSFNSDLKNVVGTMAKLEIFENEKTPSFNKFKTLLGESERILEKVTIKDHEI